MESYEDPNQTPTDAGESATGHDVPVGRAAVPPASEPTAPVPATGPPSGNAPESQPPGSWASTYQSAASAPIHDAAGPADVPAHGWRPTPATDSAATDSSTAESPAAYGSTAESPAAYGSTAGSAGAYSSTTNSAAVDNSAAANAAGDGSAGYNSAGYDSAEPLPRPAGLLPSTAMASYGDIATTMAPPAHAARTRRFGRRFVLAGVAAIVLAAGGGFAGAASVHAFDHTSTSSAAATSVQTVAGTNSVAGVVAAVDQQVVSITVRGQQQADEGSGVVVRSDGLILTNNHVIAAAVDGGTVQVTFTDGQTANATIVKADPQEDLALIQAEGVSGLKAATFGDSDNLQIGDTVIAIGNELGLSNSVTAGIVSALHRQVSVGGDSGGPGQSVAQSSGTTYNDAIQTDASTNQGDSGGALFNLAGQVVGINSAIATGSSGSTGSVGIGFAISSNTAQKFINSSVNS